MVVGEPRVKLATGTSPKRTSEAPPKLLPLMVTTLPPEVVPELVMPVTWGGGAAR
jgi:hypothetical protein